MGDYSWCSLRLMHLNAVGRAVRVFGAAPYQASKKPGIDLCRLRFRHPPRVGGLTKVSRLKSLLREQQVDESS